MSSGDGSASGGTEPAGTDRSRPWWAWPLGLLGAANLLGFALTFQSYAYQVTRGREADFWEVAGYTLPDWYIWAALAPLILWLGRHFPLAKPRFRRHLATHVGIGGLFAFGELFLSCVLISLVAGLPANTSSLWDYYLAVILVWTFPNFLTYWVILAAGQAYHYYRRYRDSELQAIHLQRQLAEARLRALKMQLHPHFLFNTLHSIGVLVRKRDHEGALRMLTGLGDLLRHTLESGREEVCLEEELEFIRRYLEVEQVRFGSRLRVAYSVDPDVRSARVPNLILQPLVENAVRHAVAPYASPRTIVVEAAPAGRKLRLTVRDDGPGVPTGWSPDEERGLGLRNVRERLLGLYGGAAAFEAGRGEQGGVVVRLTIPLRLDPDGVTDGGAPDVEDGSLPRTASAGVG